MSMELYILSEKTLATIGDWQRAIDAKGFDLKLSNERALADAQGGLPVVLSGKPTVFSCDTIAVSDVVAEWPGVKFDRKWKFAIVLRWGADFDAGAAAYAAGACYAEAVEGRLLDGEEGRIITPKQGFKIAREMSQNKVSVEDIRRAIEAYFGEGYLQKRS